MKASMAQVRLVQAQETQIEQIEALHQLVQTLNQKLDEVRIALSALQESLFPPEAALTSESSAVVMESEIRSRKPRAKSE